MYDFSLYLPQNVGVTELSIVPDLSDKNETVQRAVCLLLLHEDARLKINGHHILSFLRQTTNRDLRAVSQMFTPVADRLVELLNEDQESATDVVFSLSDEGNRLSVTINITEPSGSTASSILYTNES